MFRSPGRGAVTAATAISIALIGAGSASAATFNVDKKFDDNDATCEVGDCSLREAVSAANATAGADTINLPAGRYILGDDGEESVSFGNIAVQDGTITLVGAGADDTVIDGSSRSRAFRLSDGGVLDASGVTIRSGFAFSDGCEGPCNGAQDGGAAFVAAGSTLRLTDAVLENNRARRYGGAIFTQGGRVELDAVDVRDNHASQRGGGIGSQGGIVTIVDSHFHANTTGGSGGAIDVSPPEQQPAGFAPIVADLLNGEASALDLTVDDSTFSRNSANDRGGAIALFEPKPSEDNDQVEITAVEQSLPGADLAPKVQFVNTTIAQNSADADVAPGGDGGGLYTDGIAVQFVNSTIAGNSSDAFNNQGANLTNDFGNIRLKNTIVSSGTGAQTADANCEGLIIDQGNNIDSGENCGITESTSREDVDPQLAPLRDNGGPTPTMALKPGSPAIDAAAATGGVGFDQRGGDRPPEAGSPGSAPDIGAYEANSLADLSVDAKFDAPDPVTVGNTLSYPIVVRNNGPDTINAVELEDALPDGVTLVGVTSSAGTCNGATCNLGSLAPGTVVRLAVTVTPTATGTLTNSATVSAQAITDPDPSNDAASAATTVGPAPAPPQGTNTTTTVVVPGPTTPSQTTETDDDIDLKIKVPKTVSLDQFFAGITVQAECVGEKCLRKFREHAAINTGATQIAGFNLTVSRTSLGFVSKKSVKLQPCKSGADAGRRHKRCLRNLRKAAEKAKPFRVKVVVEAVDKAGNRASDKAFVTVE